MKTLTRVAALAADRGLAVLLAGGHAVVAHGYARTTFDLDLVVARQDRDRWLGLAMEAGYSLHKEGPSFLQFNPPGPELLPLDLMIVGDDTFSKLMAGASPAPAGGTSARVVSLRHLLAMKCHAIKHTHPGRIVKDADDVIRLVQVNRLDPETSEIRDLVLRYGTLELYEKLRKACRQP